MFKFLKSKKETEYVQSPIILNDENNNKDTVIAICTDCEKEFKMTDHYYCNREDCKTYLNCFVSKQGSPQKHSGRISYDKDGNKKFEPTE